MRFAFLADGKLFLKEDGREAVEIESPFALEAADRAAARSERQAWKRAHDGTSGPFASRMIWGRQAGDHQDWHPVMRSLARGAQAGELLYAQAMSASAGLFRYRLETREEYRLFHRQDFDACGVSCDAASGRIIVASRSKDELGKLQRIDSADRRNDWLTAGDGHDSNPSHDSANPAVIYFQSSGVGRDERGQVAALGPAAIHRLDSASGEMTTVMEDENWDFLLPKSDRAGALYYIRRPYRSGQTVSLGRSFKAFLTVPFTLASAAFGFLDAFSRMFGKKSLRPAGGGSDLPHQRSRFATFHDTTVELEKVLEQRDRKGDAAQLVPATWELIRRDASGDESVLAQHVVAFDLAPDGAVVYSDGLRVWSAGPPRQKLLDGHVVQSVVIV
ncbi:MAG TPA: hypothetical protein VHD32_10510 [Candidatus Didemnitutus sp.]|nr:hypothetical protein [Candidatus Didemnitutus sp.]